MFSAGKGRLIDEEGIDWWDLTSLYLVQEALAVLALRRLALEIEPSAELWASRSAGAVNLLAALLGRELRSFGRGAVARSVAGAMRYAGLARRFSATQIKEIGLDKYDSAYRWRSRFARRPDPSPEPVVLVPSAYGNVSRMANAYARLLPQQRFLTVSTRRSGRRFVPPPNMQVRDLAAYAKAVPPLAEIGTLRKSWDRLRVELQALPDLCVLSRTGLLNPISDWIRDGLYVRNAWREVLEREPVCGVLCGDDTNIHTALPVLLAARRKIPTVDFHHGAFDGRYLVKDLRCDVYLAKSEMERDYLVRVCGLPGERVVIGAPSLEAVHPYNLKSEKTSVIFFSEPYELVGMRAKEVFLELLPHLCRLARANGHGVIVKLHPFESLSQRRRMIRQILTDEDAPLVTVVDGALTQALMSQAWFGITVESTTVIDCLQYGVPCFLCGWLKLSPFEYGQQYARFGVGEALHAVEQVAGVPTRLAAWQNRASQASTTVDPVQLQRWLTARSGDCADLRSVS